MKSILALIAAGSVACMPYVQEKENEWQKSMNYAAEYVAEKHDLTDYGAPKIYLRNLDIYSHAYYESEYDVIVLNDFYLDCDLENILTDIKKVDDSRTDELEFAYQCDEKFLTGILMHEFTHYWMDKRNEELNLENFPKKHIVSNKEIKKGSAKEKGLILIMEGVAEYVRYGSDKREYRKPDDMNEVIILSYIWGRKIVSPILDEFGIEKSVDYFLQNIPEINKVEDIESFQKEALEKLRKK